MLRGGYVRLADESDQGRSRALDRAGGGGRRAPCRPQGIGRVDPGGDGADATEDRHSVASAAIRGLDRSRDSVGGTAQRANFREALAFAGQRPTGDAGGESAPNRTRRSHPTRKPLSAEIRSGSLVG